MARGPRIVARVATYLLFDEGPHLPATALAATMIEAPIEDVEGAVEAWAEPWTKTSIRTYVLCRYLDLRADRKDPASQRASYARFARLRRR